MIAVFAQAVGENGEAERFLLEDVRESIEDMVQVMQSYKNKNAVSKVLVSTLCKRRQEEAEASIDAAMHRLQVSESAIYASLLMVDGCPCGVVLEIHA